MKFARYLEDTRIPEWKRAYIDFKGLKKRIAVIRKARQGTRGAQLPDSTLQPVTEEATQQHSYGSLDHTPPLFRHSRSTSDVGRLQQIEGVYRSKRRESPPPDLRSGNKSPHLSFRGNPSSDRRLSASRLLPTLTRRKSTKPQNRTYNTLESLYSHLEPLELSFFGYLNRELEKVNAFYNEHESDAISKLSALKDQVRELRDHRRLFHEAQLAARSPSWTMLSHSLGAILGVSKGRHLKATHAADLHEHATTSSHIPRDPAEYHRAKRRLRKAIEEFYRSLELLNDYRVLNLTGFRKALKKFEKVTGHPAQDLYMKEKIHSLRFVSSGTMDNAMRDVENLYATGFENGDIKKSRERLKAPFQQKSHYSSMFRSGIYIGLAVPAIVSAIYSSFQPETRLVIPEWGPLLEIYATLLIPVLFSLLIGVNLLAWTHARINFPFIFELDVRTAIDMREYIELPAFLFATLCCASWLSFYTIGSHHIAPTTWPIIWLGLAAGIVINPLPVFARGARFWLIKNTSKLLVAGASRVEFTDFWLGDQFCSLVFSLTHIYTIGCAYSVDWHNVFEHCGSVTHWAAALVLLVLPYLSRFMQSLRRYRDSRLPTHLVNGGKYLSSIVTYATYFIWRSRGSGRDITFVVWCMFATFSSIYTSSWDVLMDWSFFQRYSSHRFLRHDLLYSNNPLVYYFAIVSNVLIRFIWVIYIPSGGLNNRVRAVIVAGLEMLRRIQWNFYRLENEQIGNTDQYRATREVPLPYSSTYRQGNGSDEEKDSDFADETASSLALDPLAGPLGLGAYDSGNGGEGDGENGPDSGDRSAWDAVLTSRALTTRWGLGERSGNVSTGSVTAVSEM